jgi:proline dehydrogenase
MLRKVVQSVLINSRVQSLVESSSVGEATAAQFIAGSHVNDAVDSVVALKDSGYLATVERILEPAEDEIQSRTNALSYIDCIRALAGADLGEDLDITVQLSALGLTLSNGEAIATENLSKVCQSAQDAHMSVTIGMDQLEDVPATLRIAHTLSEKFSNLGITLQSSLLRSEQDAAVFAASGARVRLCKGTVTQDPEHAYVDRAEIDKAFVREMRTLLRSTAYVMIATHDPRLLQIGQALALRAGRLKDSFEFQMYLGVRKDEQQRLLALNHRVRIHVPFGEQWYPVVTDRLARQPKSIGTALGSLIRRKS